MNGSRFRGRPITALVAVIALLVASCSSGDGTSDGADAAPVGSTTIGSATSATIESVPEAASTEFYCGEFGSERAPTLLAIDTATAMPVWKMCSDATIPLYISGRADGATLLWEQDGRGGAALAAIDDTGIERWRRPTRSDGPGNGLFIGGSTAVVMTDVVEAIDAPTGDVRWTHPVGEGTPIGTSDDLVIEVSGGPYALSSDVSDTTGEATMRGLDVASGEERWSRPVELVDGPMSGQFTPTVGDEVIAVPDMRGNTAIIDASTGDDLPSVEGAAEASGALLGVRDPMTYRIEALVEPGSGTRTPMPEGSPVMTMAYRGLPQAASGLLLTSETTTGPAATLRLVDTTTGQDRWEIPYMNVIGASDDQVFLAEGPLLQVIDATDGTLAAEYRAPTDLATFNGAVGGDGIVIVTAEWRGSPNVTTDTTPMEEAMPTNCGGGPTLLDTELGGIPFVVTESFDGTIFCLDEGGSTTIGRVPTTPTADPRQDGMATSPTSVGYAIALPEGFASSVTAVADDGEEVPVARGVASDYLVLVERIVPKDGEMPQMVQRTIELRGEDGVVLARVEFTGFATEEFATYEDFFACAAEHGVPMDTLSTRPTAAGAPPPTLAPSPPDVLRETWLACRDVLAGAMRSSDPNRADQVDGFLVELDCVAEAGFYPSLAQPVSDQNALNEAWARCREEAGS